MSTNGALTTLVNAPGTSGTSFTLAANTGAWFVAGPAIVYRAGTTVFSKPNLEAVTLGAPSGDTVTVTRAQQGHDALALAAGDYLAQGIDALSWDTLKASVTAGASAVAGVSITGSASAGRAVVATSASAAAWTDVATQAELDAVVAAATGTYARLPGPLGGWKAKLLLDPSNAKVVFSGDSTSDAALNAGQIVRTLDALHTQPGEALTGMASTDYFTDGVGNGTTTFTSAAASFTSADVGRVVHGTNNIPNATKINSVTNSTTVVLNNSVTAGSGQKFWVARHLIAGGNNGMDLATWFANPGGAYPYNRNQLVTDNPDLTVYSWLINDMRTGGLGLTESAIFTAGTARLKALIDWHRANLTGDILLRIPNPFLTANVGGTNYITDGTNVNPAGLAQIYTNAMRRIYLGFVGKYPNVDVLDTHAEVFGTICAASHPLLADQLHPNGNLTGDASGLTLLGGGYPAIANAVAEKIGVGRNGTSPIATRIRHEFIVSEGPANGTIRLTSRDPYGLPATQAPVFATDSLYINGLDSPVSLTGANVDRTFSTTILQISSITGSPDFTPYVGKTAVVTGSHAPMTTGNRQIAFIDLPSIAAGATVTADVTLSGVAFANGQSGSAQAVVACPNWGFTGAGLLLVGCYPVNTNVVRIVITNPTGGAIDRAGENWTFWVIR